MSIKSGYIVELEKGVYLAPWDGDPGRTLDYNKAKVFKTADEARVALKYAREYAPFLKAGIFLFTKTYNRFYLK